jgi:hypothetical protein
MDRRLWAAPLTAALVLALSASALRAQPPEAAPPPMAVTQLPPVIVPTPVPVPVPTTATTTILPPLTPASGGGIDLSVYAPPSGYAPYPNGPVWFAQPPEPPRRPQPIHDCLRSVNIGCFATHNSVGCGSLKAECVYIFGSCRAFYGEPCLPPPPGVHGSPYGNGNGNGAGPARCPSCQ